MISKNGRVIGKQPLQLNNKQIELLEKYKRNELDITKTELARLLGISRSVLYKKVLADK